MAPNKSSKRPISTRKVVVAKLKKHLPRSCKACKLSRRTSKTLVTKEVRKQLLKFLHDVNSLAGSLPNQAEPSVQRRLLLHFVSELPKILFTATTVHAIAGEIEGNTTLPVKVILLDENNVIVNEGPLSSLKVEIFVACGNVDTGEPNASMVVARPHKGSLLAGNCVKTMENGVCSFNDLKFLDNSSWMSCKTFKLVAKVAESAQLPSTVEIQQGVTGSFQVKDQRGKSNVKHLILSLDDDVRHLEKIGAKCNEKLKAASIFTVKDFLRKYYVDESSLKRVLGVKDGMWKSIVEHAIQCVPNGEHFRYVSEVQEHAGDDLIFDCFYKLIGVTYHHQNYRSFETLTDIEKWQVEQVRRSAFEPENKLVPISLPLYSPTLQEKAVQDKYDTFNYIPSYPQSPLLENHVQEQAVTQSIARTEETCSISDRLLGDTLIIDDEYQSMQEVQLFGVRFRTQN